MCFFGCGLILGLGLYKGLIQRLNRCVVRLVIEKKSYQQGRWTPGDRPVNRRSRAFLFVAIGWRVNRTYIATPERRFNKKKPTDSRVLERVPPKCKTKLAKWIKTGSARRLSCQGGDSFKWTSSQVSAWRYGIFVSHRGPKHHGFKTASFEHAKVGLLVFIKPMASFTALRPRKGFKPTKASAHPSLRHRKLLWFQ